MQPFSPGKKKKKKKVSTHDNRKQVRTSIKNLLKGKEESACDQNKDHSEVEDSSLSGHHNPAIAVELVPAWKNLPFSL